MALSKQEREQFLAQPLIGAFSVGERSDRAPLTVPIWYQYAPGSELWVHTEATSRKAQAVRAAGRFSLMVQRVDPTVRYVTVEGPVTSINAGSPEQAREMAARYLPADKVDEFLEYEQNQLGEDIVISMRPEHWVSADLGAL